MNKQQKGFTLLEILLVIALIAILAGIVIVAINPAKQTADARNTQRTSDVNTILNAVYQYSIDNSGAMPSGIPTSVSCPGTGASEICKKGAACTGLVDLSALTTNAKYIVSIPFDPTGSTTNGTAYNIVKTTDNRIIVCAPSAENSTVINITN
ncbi:MAG: type II secretion system protein [Candidatus Staskawiczbacteria bacterium]